MLSVVKYSSVINSHVNAYKTGHVILFDLKVWVQQEFG